MKKRLFLSGLIGCGKSTLIKNVLGDAAKAAGGFVTVRALDERGSLVGFDLLPACSLACRERKCPAFRFLSFSGGEAKSDSAVFRTEAVRLLNEAVKKPFAVLDEFGGFELLLPEFDSALKSFLKSGVPCIGVLKTPEAAAELSTRACLPQEYADLSAQLLTFMMSDPDTEVLPISGRNDKNALDALCAWAKEYAHER